MPSHLVKVISEYKSPKNPRKNVKLLGTGFVVQTNYEIGFAVLTCAHCIVSESHQTYYSEYSIEQIEELVSLNIIFSSDNKHQTKVIGIEYFIHTDRGDIALIRISSKPSISKPVLLRPSSQFLGQEAVLHGMDTYVNSGTIQNKFNIDANSFKCIQFDSRMPLVESQSGGPISPQEGQSMGTSLGLCLIIYLSDIASAWQFLQKSFGNIYQ